MVSLHAHTFLLTGLGMLLFAVVYALLPMLTKLEWRSQRLVDVHFWFWIVGSVGMAYTMGRAGASGMLRRTLYDCTLYQPYLTVALIGALVMAIGFLAFLVNVLATLGWANTISLVIPEKWLKPRVGQAKP